MGRNVTDLPLETERIHSCRIALFVSSLRGGGAERVMLEIAGGLARRGLSVDLVLARAEGPYMELLSKDVRLIDLGSNRTVTSFHKLIRYLHRDRPDVLLSTLEVTNVLALIARKFFFRDLRLVVRQAIPLSMEMTHGSFRVRIIQRILKHLLPAADAVVGVSSGVAADLRRNVPRASDLILAIPNPVGIADIAEKAALPMEHPWFSDDSGPVILSAGRLTSVKDHATLLRAFSDVIRSRPAHLVILGVGPERENLLELAQRLGVSHQVDLPGFMLNPFAYMSKARVFALPSRYEGFPNVLVQAMACGTPVVSTDCRSGPSEILEDGKWGHLVPVGDWRAMAKAILDTLDNPIPSDELIARASDFSADASIDRYMEVLTGRPN